jgi:hypothetical protein
MPTEQDAKAVVVALAGRRIDAPGSDPPRFPLDNVPTVRTRLKELMSAEHAIGLVCSAACGADLIALEEAERLRIRRRIVLPFRPERFRETSVTDRPGDWASTYDRLISIAKDDGDLIVLGDQEGAQAYAATNEVIVREAKALAQTDTPCRILAVIVWEGAPRDGTDTTEGFRSLAARGGLEGRRILTL